VLKRSMRRRDPPWPLSSMPPTDATISSCTSSSGYERRWCLGLVPFL
jgi:hypothetical protein